MRVLNVGGGANRELPAHFNEWSQHILDIDPAVDPDVCLDAKEMRTMKAGSYDAIFCSHNLEHFYKHEVPVVLEGFMHVLSPKGFAQIMVPDVMALMEAVVSGERDISETWYRAGSGKVTFHDVLYGWNLAMEKGNLYYAHKCGFSEKSLGAALRDAGFKAVFIARTGFDLHAFAFKAKPSEEQKQRLGL